MRIIKHGEEKIAKKVKKFACKDCGCIFEAEKGEYEVGSQYNKTYYSCKCPYCENTVCTD